jgi:hypothetical protein
VSTPAQGALFDGATAQQIEALTADTPDEEKHQRQMMGRNGPITDAQGQPIMLTYVTARFVQDRLDDAVGPTNWQSSFTDVDGGIRCGIGILVAREGGTPEWVWKHDVGVHSNIERIKGAHSDAFKRAGVQWGIARDLYDERDDRHEEDFAPAPAAAVPPAVAPPIAQQVGVPVVPQTVAAPAMVPSYAGQVVPPPAPVMAAPPVAGQMPVWACPLHNSVKLVPAGISRKSNRAYDAFLACDVAGCDQKGPSVK